MSIFTKIISIVVTVLCALNIMAPTGIKKANPPKVSAPVVKEVQEKTDENKNSEYEMVEDKTINIADKNTSVEEKKDEQDTDTAPVKDTNTDTDTDTDTNTDTDTTPVEGADNDADNDADLDADSDADADEEYSNYEVLDTIDISATEEDDVTLTVYAAPKLFAAPRMASAATFSLYNDEAAAVVSDDTASGVTINFVETQKDRSNDSTLITAVVSGEGEMEANVYRHFIDVNSFIEHSCAVIAADNGLNRDEVDYILPDDVDLTDVFDVDAKICYYTLVDCEAGPARTRLEISDKAREALNPSATLKYSPNTVVIEDGVTSISEGAFLFCNDLKELVLPNTVKSIGENAFAYCRNLESVTFNEGLESIGRAAFLQCTSLEKIVLPSTINYIGDEAFGFIKQDSRIICSNDDVYRLTNSYSYDVITPGRTIIEVA